MSSSFPHEIAFLSRTKLSYINLPALLADGKRDREARVPGFVVLDLGETRDVIFIREGEPFNAARSEGATRAPVAIAEVLRFASERIAHGEQGHIGYYGAPETQMRAMLATFLHAPVPDDGIRAGTSPERFFATLSERHFSGVVELRDGRGFHYLCMREGEFEAGFFSGRAPGTAIGAFLRSLWEAGQPHPEIRLFAALAELPVQAPPGLVEMYRRLLHSVSGRLSERSGAEFARTTMCRGYTRAGARYPLLSAFQVTENGRVIGNPIAAPEQLTEAMAAWLVEVLADAADRNGTDPSDVLEGTTRDDRFVLAQQGFFGAIPWAVGP